MGRWESVNRHFQELASTEPGTVTGRSEVGGCDSSQLVGNIVLSLPGGPADDGSAVAPRCRVQ